MDDNRDVFLVSTIHSGHETVNKRRRRRPRINQGNQLHVKTVWGQNQTDAI
jgi:hypothetical protein